MRPERLTREAVLDDAAARMELAGTFPDRRAVVDAVFRLRWRSRACGVHGIGEFADPTGTVYTGFCVEVPRSKFDRVSCFANAGEGYRLLDTFLLPSTAYVRSFTLAGNVLRFSDVRGQFIFERAVGAA